MISKDKQQDLLHQFYMFATLQPTHLSKLEQFRLQLLGAAIALGDETPDEWREAIRTNTVDRIYSRIAPSNVQLASRLMYWVIDLNSQEVHVATDDLLIARSRRKELDPINSLIAIRLE